MSDSREHEIDIARAQASAYVWGRQDAGERDTGFSLDFGEAYATRKRAYLYGETGYMPSIETAFLDWRDENTTEDEA